MPRHKKDAMILNCKIQTDIMKELEKHCKKTGQTKTMAVERAILNYVKLCKNNKG